MKRSMLKAVTFLRFSLPSPNELMAEAFLSGLTLPLGL